MPTKLVSKSFSTLGLWVILGFFTGSELHKAPFKPDILETDWHWDSPDDTDDLYQSRAGDAVHDEDPFFSFGMNIYIFLVLCTIIVGIIVGRRIAREPIKSSADADTSRFAPRNKPLKNLSTNSSASSTASSAVNTRR